MDQARRSTQILVFSQPGILRSGSVSVTISSGLILFRPGSFPVRFSPTMRSEFDVREKEIRFLHSILPIARQALETAPPIPTLGRNLIGSPTRPLYRQGINSDFAGWPKSLLSAL